MGNDLGLRGWCFQLRACDNAICHAKRAEAKSANAEAAVHEQIRSSMARASWQLIDENAPADAVVS